MIVGDQRKYQRKYQMMWVDRLARLLLLLYAAERGLKALALWDFFRRPAPVRGTAAWPAVTLLQPVTQGASNLAAVLAARARLHYDGRVQLLLICDREDAESQAVCRAHLAEFPGLDAQIILAAPDTAAGVALKVTKLLAGLPHATGAVLCFVDDDVLLPPDALQTLLPYLDQPGVGAVFGLACYTDWSNHGSALMSAFVNANALPSYVPLTYLSDPYTITGHCFALRREIFAAAGGLDGLGLHVGDDHMLAWRLQGIGLRCVQTPLIYRIENHFATRRAYAGQMKRWFIFPRQNLLPLLTPRQRLVSLLASVGNLIPGLLALLALLTRRRSAALASGISLGLFAALMAWIDRRFYRAATPWRHWPYLLLTALIAPFQVLGALLADDQVEWRGQRWRIQRGGAAR